MKRLLNLFDQIPKTALFAVAGLIQIGLLGGMVADHASILRTGTEVTLRTRAVDPRDFLRGDYVTLNYDISRITSGQLTGTPSEGPNTPVYVKLAPNPDGYYVAVSVDREPLVVTGAEILVRGRVITGAECGPPAQRIFCPGYLRISYGIERYFVPEGEGHAIEKARNDSKLAVVAAISSNGRAAIKRLLIDGNPVYDEPLY